MDFWKTLVVLVRRWYVALPALVVSLGLAAVAYESVPSKFEATGSVVLLSPSGGASTRSDAGQTNPLLAFDGSLTTVSTAITQVLLSPAVSEDLYRSGATASYEVGNGNLDGPFVNVVADGRSPAEAQRTVRLVLDRARTELTDRQAAHHAPPSTYIQVDDLVRPTEAKKLVGGRVRAAGAALALGLAASISTAFMIESIGENRRERRNGAGRGGPATTAATTQVVLPVNHAHPVPSVPPVASVFPDPFADGHAERHAARHRAGWGTDRDRGRGPDPAADTGTDRAERRNGHHPQHHRHPAADRGDAERTTERTTERTAEHGPDRPRAAEVNGQHAGDELSAVLARRARGRAQD